MLQIVLIIFLSGIFQRNSPPSPPQSGIFLLPRGLVQQYESQ